VGTSRAFNEPAQYAPLTGPLRFGLVQRDRRSKQRQKGGCPGVFDSVHLHVTHVFSRAFEQSRRVGESGPTPELDVHVLLEREDPTDKVGAGEPIVPPFSLDSKVRSDLFDSGDDELLNVGDPARLRRIGLRQVATPTTNQSAGLQ
jgi:hypothetical protein